MRKSRLGYVHLEVKSGLGFRIEKALSSGIGEGLPKPWLCTALRLNDREKHVIKVRVYLTQAKKIGDQL